MTAQTQPEASASSSDSDKATLASIIPTIPPIPDPVTAAPAAPPTPPVAPTAPLTPPATVPAVTTPPVAPTPAPVVAPTPPVATTPTPPITNPAPTPPITTKEPITNEKQSDEEIEKYTTTNEGEIPLEKKNAKLYKIGTILFVIILISTISVLYMRTRISTVTTDVETNNPSPSPVVDVSPTLTPTPKVEALKRSEITLEILNGTATSGLAGTTAERFEELGYKIENTGNADDVESNQLYVKTEFSDQLSNLLEDVSDELEIIEIEKEIDDLDVTARIILGGN